MTGMGQTIGVPFITKNAIRVNEGCDIMLDKINHEALSRLQSDAFEIRKAMQTYEVKIDEIKKEISNILPKCYWYSCEIDPNWHRPKKYSIKEINVYGNGSVRVTIKEVFKKLPWPGFTGRHDYSLNDFLKLKIYKTAEEATESYLHRICPKCGGFMMYSDQPWCQICMNERCRIAKEFNDNHTFYYPENDAVYVAKYEDELTNERGYNGEHFILRRIDTGEIIRTSNLWSVGFGVWCKDLDKLPKIEFLK